MFPQVSNCQRCTDTRLDPSLKAVRPKATSATTELAKAGLNYFLSRSSAYMEQKLEANQTSLSAVVITLFESASFPSLK